MIPMRICRIGIHPSLSANQTFRGLNQSNYFYTKSPILRSGHYSKFGKQPEVVAGKQILLAFSEQVYSSKVSQEGCSPFHPSHPRIVLDILPCCVNRFSENNFYVLAGKSPTMQDPIQPHPSSLKSPVHFLNQMVLLPIKSQPRVLFKYLGLLDQPSIIMSNNPAVFPAKLVKNHVLFLRMDV